MTTQSSARSRATDGVSFEADLKSAPWVLVKFTGAWCGPCRALQPTLEQLVADRSDVAVLSVDVDASTALAERFGVRAVPTLVAFRGGSPLGQLVGNQPRRAIDALLRGV